MARSLSARIAIAFIVLSVALLVGVGGTLFVVLKGLHTEAQDARLSDLADGLGARARELVTGGTRPNEVLAGLRDEIPAGVTVTFRTADGRLVRLADAGPVGPVDADPASATGAIAHGSATDVEGRPLRYALIAIRPQSGTSARAVIFSAPDTSSEMAARDVVRTLPVVALVLMLVGAPTGWLLWRSVAHPLRALSDASALVPAGGADPIPLSGPTEVRELTGHFNLMTAELGARRREEADLIANLRHDLRTPLTVIGGFAQALGDGTATGPDATRAAGAIAEEADRLGRMLAELDVADEAAAGMLRPVVLDASTVVADVLARFAGAAETAGVRLIGGEMPATTLIFSADPVAVDRIMANLVENALAAIPRGGTVRISAETDAAAPDPPRRGRTRRLPRPPAVRFTVEDDGPGFPPGSRERVFERFYRADSARSGPGSGLGLSIVRDLARAHGGDAWAEDVAPHGGRVVVRLSAIPGPAETAGQTGGSDAP
jgi:signal transduction histidine kinase